MNNSIFKTKFKKLGPKFELWIVRQRFFFEHAVIIRACGISNDKDNKGYKLVTLFFSLAKVKTKIQKFKF